jgi:phage pi2 protein 07
LSLAFFLLFIYFKVESDLSKVKLETIDKFIEITNILEALDNKISYLSNRSSDMWNYIYEVDNKVRDVSSRLEDLSQKTIKAPSLQILKDFIKEDDTDKMQYVEGKFECADFSYRFMMNFLKKGYFSCVSYVESEDKAHAIVAVNTTDAGIVYVEPQYDKIIYDLEVGDNYCEKVNLKCYFPIKRIVDCYHYGE